MNQTIGFLLDNACPSIRYRVKREILDEISPQEEEKLQSQILEDKLLREFIERQNSDGWIDEDFHSEKGVETAIRLFSEKGVLASQPSFKVMLEELERREDTFDKGCLFNIGKILDHKSFGGSKVIRAAAFAQAGIEDKHFIKEQIELALDKLKFVCSVSTIDSVAKQYKDKLVFKDGTKWPCIYDLRLLAYTKGWRSEENKRTVVVSIKKMIELSPIPYIHILERNQLIAPAAFCMQDFNPDVNKLKDSEWMMWFHRMEILSRLGVASEIKELKQHLDFLAELLRENNGIFNKRMNHYYFTKWSPYSGLALEKDWRSGTRRICDLTFRSLLILHYSGYREL
ncbi:hypothetical protein [Lutispora thermophila]|uniref:Uncharacterized protein n=1 Tax=Lutispora thermophila DSM 19022 TaxID=1122184 RepID=A0A1M6E4K2_9FIRM|nr:hypothetical protein [Lutispora thermophila]SHI80319.1 hypothetical protein SAMN02745176_01410 [Lutispora thermophila DSM 19022]